MFPCGESLQRYAVKMFGNREPRRPSVKYVIHEAQDPSKEGRTLRVSQEISQYVSGFYHSVQTPLSSFVPVRYLCEHWIQGQFVMAAV